MTVLTVGRLRRPGEFPRAFMLLVWTGFAVALLLSALGWSPLRLALAPRHPTKLAAATTVLNNDEIYTGSIYFVPLIGEHCWERMLDNRNGDMWDKGYVDCDEVLRPQKPATTSPRRSMSGERMLAISRALRHDGD